MERTLPLSSNQKKGSIRVCFEGLIAFKSFDFKK